MPVTDRPRRGLTAPQTDNSPTTKPAPTGGTGASTLDSDHDSELSSAIQSVIERLLTFISKLISTIKAKLLNELCETICSDVKDSLQFDVDTVNNRMSTMEKRLQRIEEASEEAEQYSRRNCLVFAGIDESSGENVEATVIDICKDDLRINVEKGDIDRCHRLGPMAGGAKRSQATTKAKKQHRDVIVKFATYRTRDEVYKARFNLRKATSKSKTVYINESLTQGRSKLYCKVKRGLDSRDFKLWTQDGRIIVKKPNGEKITIVRERDLVRLNLNT
ncbi:uncharacterized protein [Diadema antillarum]|uniref:uncharacterized protein n=1 Tax=Diadema antillarum TaxID=105358 RepID=UPI003A837EA4